nr:sensor histidine kinase [Rhizobium sp. RCAM05973]
MPIFCRPNAINRALINLIENAIHFGETILVTASLEAGTIVVELADDGPGIPKDRLRDVVEPFVRLDPSRSSRPGSVGLGLSIVKEIVEAHGGTLELIDRLPTGLIARVVFPSRN